MLAAMLELLAAMLDYGDLIKLTSEMDSLSSTTHRKRYYTILANLEQKLNIDKSRWLAAILDSENGSS